MEFRAIKKAKKFFSENDPEEIKANFKKWIKKHKGLLEATGIGSLILGGLAHVKEAMFVGVGFIILANIFQEKEVKQK